MFPAIPYAIVPRGENGGFIQDVTGVTILPTYLLPFCVRGRHWKSFLIRLSLRMAIRPLRKSAREENLEEYFQNVKGWHSLCFFST